MHAHRAENIYNSTDQYNQHYYYSAEHHYNVYINENKRIITAYVASLFYKRLCATFAIYSVNHVQYRVRQKSPVYFNPVPHEKL